MLYLANSRFVAERMKTMLGLDCQFLPSLIHLDRYAT